MSKVRFKTLVSMILMLLMFQFFHGLSWAVDPVVAPIGLSPTAETVASSSGSNMTLWQMLVAGGWVMIVIGALSVVAVAITIYELTTVKVEKLLPHEFFEKALSKLQKTNLKGVKEMCLKENNMLAKILLAGLTKGEKNWSDVSLIKEAMEQQSRTEIGKLWQTLNYLSDIVAVAPLLGLLGTVLGMIEAFHAAPIQSTGVKTALLAAGISKAMITTAAGLIVAIAALMAYSYLRGKVQEVTSAIESYSTDLIKIMESL